MELPRTRSGPVIRFFSDYLDGLALLASSSVFDNIGHYAPSFWSFPLEQSAIAETEKAPVSQNDMVGEKDFVCLEM